LICNKFMIGEDNKTKLDPKEVERSRWVVLDYIGGKAQKHPTSLKLRGTGENTETLKQENTETLKLKSIETPAPLTDRRGRQKYSSVLTGEAVWAGENTKTSLELERQQGNLLLASLFKKIEPIKPVVRNLKPVKTGNYSYKNEIGRLRVIFLTIVLTLLVILFLILISETMNI